MYLLHNNKHLIIFIFHIFPFSSNFCLYTFKNSLIKLKIEFLIRAVVVKINLFLLWKTDYNRLVYAIELNSSSAGL